MTYTKYPVSVSQHGTSLKQLVRSDRHSSIQQSAMPQTVVTAFIHLPSEVLTLHPLTYNVIKHFKTKGTNLTGYLLHCITVTVTKYTCSVLLTISIEKK